MEDDNSEILVGNNLSVQPGTHIAAGEGTTICIGDDCMFSGDVEMRSTDSHSICDLSSRRRTNKAKEIRIGNHVWLTAHVRILKGATIAGHCIVGNSSVVTGNLDTPHAVYAGNPCKLLKQNIEWDRKKIDLLPER